MTGFKKAEILAEGKTKALYLVEGNDHLLIIKSKNDITKNDNPDETKQMDSKAKFSTATTCLVFELLKKAGIPVAYEIQLSETEFLAWNCQMIPLEVIMRRYAVGSYLKRFPNLEKKKGEPPHRFHRLIFELFLKTTGGKFINKDGNVSMEMPIDSENGRPIDDPFIADPCYPHWYLHHPKYPLWDSRSILDRNVSPASVLPKGVTVKKIEEIARKTFLVLEGAWAQLGLRLIDFKIEFGVDTDGNLLVADVIDNDSWRLRDADWNELSKQLFRDNADMGQVADKYALVARLAEQLRIPNQTIVVWRGSKDDPPLEIPTIAGVNIEDVILSGHKSTQKSLVHLEKILTKFPEGGVILACVGMSDGLGPVLAARTSWPVIVVPLTADKDSKDKFMEDVWSSLRMPSNVPLATILKKKNAVLMALNFLAQKNPAAYMHRQYAIEELDE